jgi:hypothetical protein
MTRGPLLLGILLACTSSACGRTITDDDCKKITENMREVWASEAKRAAGGVPAERASSVIRSEGERLVSDWSAECKKELQGRRVDSKEMDCLLRAKTIDQISKCAN